MASRTRVLRDNNHIQQHVLHGACLPQSFPSIDGPNCVVSLLWQRLDDASFEDDDEKMEKAMDELINLAQTTCQPIFRELPLVIDDPPQRQDLDTFLNPKSVMLELVTIDGGPEVIRRDNVTAPCFEYQSVDMTNINTNLPKFHSQQIAVLQDLWGQRVSKVSVDGQVRVCKLAGKWLHDSLPREILSLQRIVEAVIASSIRVPSIRAFVMSVDGDVIGILIDYIQPSEEIGNLDCNLLHTIAKSRREKWARQVEETLHQLHEIDVIWGDVKPANVLIDKTDDAWIIDFGGGRTEGWVDEDLSGTKEGDLQGLEKIHKIWKA